MTRNEIFAKRLRHLRAEKEATEQKRWSARDVGRVLGMSQSTYSNYENALRIPTLDTIEQIAAFFKVNPAYVCGFSEYKGNSDSDAMLVLPAMTDKAQQFCSNSLGDFGVSPELLKKHGLTKDHILVDVIDDNAMAPQLIKGDVVIVRRLVDIDRNALPHGLYCLKNPGGETWFRWVRREIDGTIQVYPEKTTHYASFSLTPEEFQDYTVLGSVFKVIREPKPDEL